MKTVKTSYAICRSWYLEEGEGQVQLQGTLSNAKKVLDQYIYEPSCWGVQR